MKKKILFVINSMGCGGAEKSLLSLLSLMDYQKYDVTLLMFRRGGMFEPLLPPDVHIHDSLDYVCFCAQPIGKQLLSFDFRRIVARLRTSVFLRQRTARCTMRRRTGSIPRKRLTHCRNIMMLRLRGGRALRRISWLKK